MKNNGQFGFMDEKQLRNSSCIVGINLNKKHLSIAFKYLEWKLPTRGYGTLIEIDGFEQFKSKSAYDKAIKIITCEVTPSTYKRNVVDRVIDMISKAKQRKTRYNMVTPQLMRKVSYDAYEVKVVHDNALDEPEIKNAVRRLIHLYSPYNLFSPLDENIIVSFEKPVMKGIANSGAMKTFRRELNSNRMTQKKSPVKKNNTFAKSCKKMTGNVRKMGNQLNKNLKKLI